MLLLGAWFPKLVVGEAWFPRLLWGLGLVVVFGTKVVGSCCWGLGPLSCCLGWAWFLGCVFWCFIVPLE